MKRIIIFTCYTIALSVGVVLAQAGALNWNPNGSNSTISGAATGTFSYQLPAKNGTFAMTSDITAASATQSGTITLSSGAGVATFAPAFASVPVCVVSDPSGNSVKYSRTTIALNVAGVGPTVDWTCQ